MLYETLKVYLMLGGRAPKIDRDLVVGWLTRDWQDNLYPGATNAAGREELAKHLDAMLDLGRGQRPAFDLNGTLVEAAQRSLARSDIADRAYALVMSSPRPPTLEDWSVGTRAGPDADRVFESVDGRSLDKVTVPATFTYAGFHEFFMPQLVDVSEAILADQWVLGDVGKQEGIEQQLGQLGPELLKRYQRDFVAAWQSMLKSIRLKPLASDKPAYVPLSAIAAKTSPLIGLVKAIADETALTRDPHEGETSFVGDTPVDADLGQAANTVKDQMLGRVSGLKRIGIELALKKSQKQAGVSGSASRRLPGADVENEFSAFRDLVDGEPGARPIEAIVQGFASIQQSLVKAATDPAGAAAATSNLQALVVGLRSDASRLPDPLSGMVEGAARDFEDAAANSTIADLNDALNAQVTRVCETVIANRYPFSRKSDRTCRSATSPGCSRRTASSTASSPNGSRPWWT